MLTATVIGFDGTTRAYRSDDDGTQRMDALFDALAGGRGYEVEVSPAAELDRDWTLADEARERGAGGDDQVVSYRLLPEA